MAKKNKNPQLSKSQKRKLKKLEEENERTLLLSKNIETLDPQGDQPFKRNHETASFEIEAGLDEIQSKMHMDEKGHLQLMVIGREVQNHASFSLVCHNPVSGNELGLNGRFVSALSAEEVSNEDNCTPTLEVPKKSSQASSDHDARKTSNLMNPGDKKKGEGRQAFPEDLPSIYLRLGKLNKTLTVDLGKASNFPDVPLLRPPTTPTVVHVSRPDEFLYEAGYGSNHSVVRNGVIGVTQPRCIDVLATARRVAFELGLHLGKEVGFQVRHDKRIGDNCSIKFMTVVSNAHALWTEYEMINDDESEYDAEMSDDNIPTHSLVSRNKMDNTMNSLLDIFEGNSDKKCWASFQQCIAKAPEQVLR
ncbi:hypothetical protein NC652_036579 [Populus alba x Populus x berolinensis]|nr:hypothetical protein NC652_036579 [Populus alba x Populus x berolinensis]